MSAHVIVFSASYLPRLIALPPHRSPKAAPITRQAVPMTAISRSQARSRDPTLPSLSVIPERHASPDFPAFVRLYAQRHSRAGTQSPPYIHSFFGGRNPTSRRGRSPQGARTARTNVESPHRARLGRPPPTTWQQSSAASTARVSRGSEERCGGVRTRVKLDGGRAHFRSSQSVWARDTAHRPRPDRTIQASSLACDVEASQKPVSIGISR